MAQLVPNSRLKTDNQPIIPATRIQEARVAKGLLTQELSNRVGISPTALSKLENGQTKPKLSTLRLLSQALNVPIAHLGCFESLPEYSFGQRLKKARLYHGMTHKEMADFLGVSEKSVRLWQDRLVKPSPEYMEKVEAYLSILKAD
ncbi:helix-turn-helix protein [Melghirimyces profundicolus]|uniref:Helix-turn-helix protein n=1 Tax=Melghirimyces profundicolus TaxID=1242148 RepID=A0A2T6C8U3_9BACL|nr:helix-turn-helix transcriptional regulator [Melghirimyces profundicolus]PTX64730.1 helix-turn-helix protein [Melghirimyces profundicolus]